MFRMDEAGILLRQFHLIHFDVLGIIAKKLCHEYNLSRFRYQTNFGAFTGHLWYRIFGGMKNSYLDQGSEMAIRDLRALLHFYVSWSAYHSMLLPV